MTGKDAYGNPVSVGGATVVLSVAGANSATPSVTDNGNGTYTATYTPTNAGEDLITGTLNASAIGADTDGTSDGTFHLTVTAGAGSGTNSIISASPSPVVTGNQVTITVSAYDQYDNQITTGGAAVTLSVNGSNSATPSVTDNLNGTYTATYIPTHAGEDQITGTINSSAIQKDTDGTSDGTFHLTVNAGGGSASHFEITGSATQVAGTYSAITITAYDTYENIITAYAGDHALTFSGANDSPDGTHPRVKDKDNADVNFSSAATLTFTAGVATTDMSLYKTETAEIETTDGTYTTTASPDYDLNVSVTQAAVDPSKASISASPSPATAGDEVTITVTAIDLYGNPRSSGGDTLSITVTGVNPGTPAVTDNGNGTYTATYTPENVGEDLISGTINSSAIGADTDGTSDGIFHLTIDPSTCGGKSSLTLSSTKDNKLTFDVCILEGDSEESDDVSSSDDQGTGLKKLFLEADPKEVIEGEVEIKTVSDRPSDVTIPAEYPINDVIIYEYLKVNPDFANKTLNKAKLYLRVSKEWISANKIDEVVFLRSDSSGNEVLQFEKDSESDATIIYKVNSDKLPSYWTIFGVRATNTTIVDPATIDTPTNDPEPTIVEPTRPSDEEDENEEDKVLKTPRTYENEQADSDNDSTVLSEKLEDISTSMDVQAALVARHPFVAKAASVGGLAIPLMPVLVELRNPANLFFLLREILARLIGLLFSRRKKRRMWGIVYDSQTGLPLPLANVNIYNMAGKILETKFTDKLGAYFFLVPEGQYIVESKKGGYRQIVQQNFSEAKAHYQGDYFGGVLDIQNPDMVDSNIPMKKEEMNTFRMFFQKGYIKTLMDIIFWGLFAFNIYVLIVSPSLINLIIVILYILLAVILNFSIIKSRWGTVTDSQGKPQAFVTVEVLGENGTKLARAITDEYGRYLLILNSGLYRIEARGLNGIGYASKDITLINASPVHEKLVLN